jgi:hypothetical protein
MCGLEVKSTMRRHKPLRGLVEEPGLFAMELWKVSVRLIGLTLYHKGLILKRKSRHDDTHNDGFLRNLHSIYNAGLPRA